MKLKNKKLKKAKNKMQHRAEMARNRLDELLTIARQEPDGRAVAIDILKDMGTVVQLMIEQLETEQPRLISADDLHQYDPEVIDG